MFAMGSASNPKVSQLRRSAPDASDKEEPSPAASAVSGSSPAPAASPASDVASNLLAAFSTLGVAADAEATPKRAATQAAVPATPPSSGALCMRPDGSPKEPFKGERSAYLIPSVGTGAKGELRCFFTATEASLRELTFTSSEDGWWLTVPLCCLLDFERSGLRTLVLKVCHEQLRCSPEAPAWASETPVKLELHTPSVCRDVLEQLEAAFVRDDFSAAYIKTELLFSAGAGGEVWRALPKHAPSGTARPVAVKIPHVGNAEALANLHKEIQNLRLVADCPYIVRLIASYDVPNAAGLLVPHLVMEIAAGGDLMSTLIQRGAVKDAASCVLVSDEEAKVVTWRLLKALQFLHSRSLCHRDVKPDNLLLLEKLSAAQAHKAGSPAEWAQFGDPCSAKLADFGHSRLNIGTSNMRSLNVGTVSYLSPEFVALLTQQDGAAEGGAQSFTKSVDLWAAGVTLLAMLSQALPFGTLQGERGTAEAEASKMLVFHHITQRKLVSFSSEQQTVLLGRPLAAKLLVDALLNPDPEERLTAENALESEWFAGLGAGGLTTLSD